MEKIIDKIGLDMDGVLEDLQSYQISRGIVYFSKKQNVFQTDELIKNINTYDIQDIFGCTKEERMNFWKRYIWEYALLFPAREGASEITHKWHDEGRTIDIITSRVYVMRDDMLGLLFRWMVKIWLMKNKIYYDTIKFCSEENSSIDKKNACLELGTKLMVDDKIENLLSLKQEILVNCYHANWNQELTDINRVHNFYQIDKYIQDYEAKQKVLR